MSKPWKPRHDVDKSVRFSASQALYRFGRFSRAYRSRLLTGIQDVQLFCLHECGGMRLKTLLTEPRLADRALARYVVSRHLDSRSSTLQLVKHGLLGCQHPVPSLRGQLATGWENLRVWVEKRQARLQPPIPVQ